MKLWIIETEENGTYTGHTGKVYKTRKEAEEELDHIVERERFMLKFGTIGKIIISKDEPNGRMSIRTFFKNGARKHCRYWLDRVELA